VNYRGKGLDRNATRSSEEKVPEQEGENIEDGVERIGSGERDLGGRGNSGR
jgi:hypothetical protein